MILAGFGKVVLIPIGLALLIGMFAAMPAVTKILDEDVRTDDASQSLGCTTAVGATTCVLTLANPHAFSTTASLTITETSPGSGTKTGTLLRTDRTQLTVQGLVAATAFVFTVDYLVLAENLTNDQGDLLKWTPLIMVIGACAAFGWLLFSVLAGMSRLLTFLVAGGIIWATIIFLPAFQAVMAGLVVDTTNPGISAAMNVATFAILAVLLGISLLWGARALFGGGKG